MNITQLNTRAKEGPSAQFPHSNKKAQIQLIYRVSARIFIPWNGAVFYQAFKQALPPILL